MQAKAFAQTKASQPNIIVILADDLGYGDVSALNQKSKIRTPHIDMIARDGITFTDAHSSSAVCTPTRYGLMTGRYNWRSSLKSGVLPPYAGPLIPESRTTLASMLSRLGYRTAMIGKWHLGFDWFTRDSGRPFDKPGQTNIDFTAQINGGPNSAGFEYFFGLDAPNYPPYCFMENGRLLGTPDNYFPQNSELDSRAGSGQKNWNPEQILPQMQARTVQYIKKSAKSARPFFLYLPLTAPHTPIAPDKTFRGASGLNIYADFVMAVDAYVGEILKALRATGQLDNTLIVFSSDNGCSPRANFPELEGKGHHPSYVFRGQKSDIFEGGHRVPLLVQWSARIKGKQLCDKTVCLNDMMATFADINRYQLREMEGEDSFSLLPLFDKPLTGKYSREATVHHSINGSFSIRKGPWKLELTGNSGGWSVPNPGDRDTSLPPMQLYNLERDSAEIHNLYSEYPGLVHELSNLLKQYIENGRSTSGRPQKNDGTFLPERMGWMASATDDLDLNRRLTPVDSAQIFQEKDHYVWCNGAVKGKDGKYHLFYARWPHGTRSRDDDSLNYIFNGFRGWLKYSEIAYAVSDHAAGPYKFVKVILRGAADPARWDRFTVHNPQIKEFGGKYYLYYISNSFDPNFQLPNAKPEQLHWLRYNCTQKIGVLSANTMDDLINGEFERSQVPLMEPDNIRTFEVTNNPSVTEGPDGKYYMIFKSRKPNVGNMTMWMAVSERPDRGFRMLGEVFTAENMACEDPYLWYDKAHKRFYAVVKYYSKAAKLVPQFGALALVTSTDGLIWQAASHPLVSLRELKMKDGKTLNLAHLERPFLIHDEYGNPIVLMAAATELEPTGAGVPDSGRNSFAVAIQLAN